MSNDCCVYFLPTVVERKWRERQTATEGGTVTVTEVAVIMTETEVGGTGAAVGIEKTERETGTGTEMTETGGERGSDPGVWAMSVMATRGTNTDTAETRNAPGEVAVAGQLPSHINLFPHITTLMLYELLKSQETNELSVTSRGFLPSSWHTPPIP